jgi:hypothetical protein|tara:strand:- start:793 stop:1113 length:321 start_codon:yes stop_codon:yes gene_type:complete
MIKDFNSFINEAELNENPAIAAAVAPAVADMAAKKLAEGKMLEAADCASLITEMAGMYEADEDESHTAEGYLKEVVDKLNEESAMDIVAKSVAAKSPKTQAFAPQT